MWKVEIIAPNGLTATILVDEQLVQLSQSGELATLEDAIRPHLEELIERKGETNPNAA